MGGKIMHFANTEKSLNGGRDPFIVKKVVYVLSIGT
jgi:hypothetical protein